MDIPPNTPKSLSLPWKTRIYLYFLSTLTQAVSRTDGTVNRRILKLFATNMPPTSNPTNGLTTYDVVMDPARKLWFRVFVPTQHAPDDHEHDHDHDLDLPVIVFFHGGGFVYLAPNSEVYDTLCSRFARKVPAIVVSFYYRLAPENRYPTQHDDCFDLLRFLDDDENRLKSLPGNGDICRCFVAGDSAGGNLAHHVTQRACESNFKQLKVIGVIAIQPFFGGEERTQSEKEHQRTPLVSLTQCDWYWNMFMPPGESYNRDHPIINVSGPNAVDISKLNFPTTLVVVAGFDALRDWQTRYYEWLKKSGREAYLVDYPNMCHGFYVFPELPESEQLVTEVKKFIHKVCTNY